MVVSAFSDVYTVLGHYFQQTWTLSSVQAWWWDITGCGPLLKWIRRSTERRANHSCLLGWIHHPTTTLMWKYQCPTQRNTQPKTRQEDVIALHPPHRTIVYKRNPCAPHPALFVGEARMGRCVSDNGPSWSAADASILCNVFRHQQRIMLAWGSGWGSGTGWIFGLTGSTIVDC